MVVSTRSFLLAMAAAAATTASAERDFTPLTSDTWKDSEHAGLYHGHPDAEPVVLNYYTEPSADYNLYNLNQVLPVVMRLGPEVVEFTPHQYIIRGSHHPTPRCREEDDSLPPHRMRVGCLNHCQNFGRYCDLQAFEEHASYDRGMHGGHVGNIIVHESARRICAFYMYGSGEMVGDTQTSSDGMMMYFQYHAAMKATGCDKDLTTDCVEEAMVSVGMDMNVIDNCIGDLDPKLDVPNELLDNEIQFGSPNVTLPSMAVEPSNDILGDKDVSVLEHVCRSLEDAEKHPHVCGFCLSWCPYMVPDIFDINTCVWELRCGNYTYANDFLHDAKEQMEHYKWSLEHDQLPIHKFDQGIVPTVTIHRPDDLNAPWAVFDAEQEEQEREHNNNGGGEPITLYTGTVVHSGSSTTDSSPDTSSSSATTTTSDDEDSSAGLGVMAATFLGIFLAGVLTAITIMAIRITRTRRIIDRYVKEQHQAMMERDSMMNNTNGSANGHHDPAFFPEEDLDLDLEPSMQYRDHIQPAASSPAPAPPSRASFLPQIA